MQPNQQRTVIMGLEDGPAALDPGVENSQLYLYVGTKDRSAGAGVLRRNGLDNGDLYVLVPSDPSRSSKADLTSSSIHVRWALISNAGELDEAQLEAASDAAGAFRFARPEDGGFNDRNRNEFFFVTTGGAAGVNELGRLYSLELHPHNPLKQATLSVAYSADAVIAGGRGHRDQPGQHRRQQQVPDDQRGRHHGKPGRDGLEAARRQHLALRAQRRRRKAGRVLGDSRCRPQPAGA